MAKNSSAKKVSKFMRFEYVEGSLDAKTCELVLLAATSVAGCRH